MRVFFNAVIIQIILSAYIFWRGWQGLSDRKYVKIPYLTFYVIELILYFVGFFASKWLSFECLHDLAWIGTAWMVFIIYMTPLLFIYDVFKYLNKRKKLFANSLDLSSKKCRFNYFWTCIFIVLGVMMYGNYQFRHPVVTELNLKIDKPLPNINTNKLKIVVATDIHAGYLIDKSIISKYVDKIMEQKADLILLPGDIVDYDIISLKEQKMETEFNRLKAPYGVYASTGNHEYIQLSEVKEENINWLKEYTNMTLLRDSVVKVADSFYIVGREDDFCPKRKSLPQVIEGIDKSLPIIVINHEPHFLQQESDEKVDMAFYGHTHNGQFFPLNTIMSISSKLYNADLKPKGLNIKFVYELPYGYKKKDNTHIYVSSGLGLAGPQFRIGTVSEIVVINVTFDKQKN